jgi:hypothetical protein
LSLQSARWSYAISKKIAEGVSINAHLFDASDSEGYEKGEARKMSPLMRGFKPLPAQYEICVISQLCRHASSSFEHSSFSMKAYTNLHETILAVSNITLESLKDFFTK